MKYLRQYGLLIFLLLTLGLGIGLVEQQLSLYGRASVPQDLTTLEASYTPDGLARLQALRVQLEASRTVSESQEPKWGYSLRFDPHVWQRVSNESVVDPMVHVTTFTLDPSFGHATVTISVKELSTALTPQAQLESFVSLAVSDYTRKGELVSQELTTLAEVPASRLLLSETHFGESSPLEEWYVVSFGLGYRFNVRYDRVLASQAYALDLLDTLQFIQPQDAPPVQGVTTFRSEKLIYTAVEIAELVSPSVVNLTHLKCIRVKYSGRDGAYLKPEYDFCGYGKGTGFVISEEGLIATNGHVVQVSPEQSLVEQALPEENHPLVKDLVREVTYLSEKRPVSETSVGELVQTIKSNPTAFNSLLTVVFKLIESGTLRVENDVSQTYAQLGQEPIFIENKRVNSQELAQAVRPSKTIIEAKLVAADFPPRYTPDSVLRGRGSKGTDVAILKLLAGDSRRFPAVKLTSASSLKTGSPLFILGFPSVVEGDSTGYSMIDYTSAATTPTVTQGIVSALKRDSSGRLLVQTDASIERGNSGGPAFNEEAQVAGLVTFGVEATLGNYNFIRDATDLKSLLDTNQITLTTEGVSVAWQTGLSYFWNGYYTKALREFAFVQDQYPQHPTVTSYIDQASYAIEHRKDKGLILGIEKDLLVRVLIYGGMVGLGMWLVVRLLGRQSVIV